MTLPAGPLGARRSRWYCAGMIVLLALGAAGCTGPRIPAGNLKELKEKKRELKDAQRKAEQDAAAPEATAEAPPDGTPATPPVGAAAPPPAAASAALVPGTARVTVRAADGSGRQVLLRQPLVGRWERVFFSGGGVRDKDRLAAEFAFRDGTGRAVLKMKKLARVEWVAVEAGTRTRVRLRFYFRRADRPPEEFTGEDLLGAEHPVPPFLSGIDSRGVEVRLPLYPPLDPAGYEPIVEVEFGSPG